MVIVFVKVDSDTITMDTLHRIDMIFNQVNANAKTYAMEERSGDFLNYFFDYLPNGISRVQPNARLVTTNLYSNIDLEYSSNQNGVKYYFIVKPGGSPGALQLEFIGAGSINLDTTTNELTLNSNIGSITFDRPTVYQLNASNVIVPIVGWTGDWQTNGASNKFKFNIGSYDNTKPLIIQVDQGNAASSVLPPYKNLTWSTYYGGGDDDKFTDLVTDFAGDVYSSVETTSANFPVTTGVLTNPLGSALAGIVKFSKAGVRKYATYYGVTSTIQVPIINTVIDVDGLGNAFMAGEIVRTPG